MHLRMLKKLADTIMRQFFIIFKKSCQSGEVCDDWKKANITLIFQNDKKEDLGSHRVHSLGRLE